MDRASRRDIVIRPGAAEYIESDDNNPPTNAISPTSPSRNTSRHDLERHPSTCLPRKHADDMAMRRAMGSVSSASVACVSEPRCTTQAEYLVEGRPLQDPDSCKVMGRADVFADDAAYRVLRKDLQPAQPAGGLPIRGYSGEARHFGHQTNGSRDSYQSNPFKEHNSSNDSHVSSNSTTYNSPSLSAPVKHTSSVHNMVRAFEAADADTRQISKYAKADILSRLGKSTPNLNETNTGNYV